VSTNGLARESWELGIGWQAPRAAPTAASLLSSDGALAKLSLLPTARAPSNR